MDTTDWNDPMVKEVLKRMDIRKEFERWGGKILPGAEPNSKGWIESEAMFNQGYRAFINIGNGPDRGAYVEFPPDDFPDKLDG
ncbi:MAG: hypothetical protein ACOZFS_00280 [Thermodesulfobacteriota bacterium]